MISRAPLLPLVFWAWVGTAHAAPQPNPAGAAGRAAALFPAAEQGGGRQKIEAQLGVAQALWQAGLPLTASSYFAPVLKAGPGPASLQAVSGLLAIQRRLQDEYLIPSVLAAHESDDWARLSVEDFARASYLVALVEERRGQLEAARARLARVPRSSAVYGKARYLLGVVLSDPRLPGGAQNAQALEAFQDVQRLSDGRQEGLDTLHGLAQLGVARTYYAMERYAESTATYDAVPHLSRFWDQALFENGFARFRAGDLGGALGSLQALHAPQFSGAFLPESWILKGTIYFYSCLYEESKAALNAFDRLYAPMIDQLKPLAMDEQRPLDDYLNLVADENGNAVPRPVLLWVRSNERLLGVFRLLDQARQERQRLSTDPVLRANGAGAGFTAALDQTAATARQVAGQLAKNRLVEAYRNLKSFSDQAEIIKFETAKADKETVEAGIDQAALLAHQRLYRPALPADDWEYWQFEGEFWIDEIGYYRFTLKNGCPSQYLPSGQVGQGLGPSGP